MSVANPRSWPSSLKLRIFGVLALVASSAISYWPSLGGGFIWDDETLITKNSIVQSSSGLYRIWFTTEPIDYWPVTNTSFWLEWRIWGANPTGYHVTNLVLHVLNSLLIYAILQRLSIPGAFLAAWLFALHPVNVESVAWIAQRKNTLSLFFFLLSLLAYLKWHSTIWRTDKSRAVRAARSAIGLGFYWLSLLSFALAMLSKGSVAILPVLLLLIAWWQRGRITSKDVWGTAPFFVLAIVLTAVNVWFTTHGLDETIRTATFAQRLAGAGAVVWFYLYKALLPLDLVFIYPQWNIDTQRAVWWLPLLAMLCLSAVLVWKCRTRWGSVLLFAWAFFCIALLPVMGLVDVYFMKFSLAADHYQYVAIIAVVALAAAAISTGTSRLQPRWRAAVYSLTGVLLCALGMLTWRQSATYRDAVTLYKNTLAGNPSCWLADYNLGVLLADSGRSDEAIQYFQAALQLKPDYAEAYNNLGMVILNRGEPGEAVQLLEKAVGIKPKYAEAHTNLGVALMNLGRSEDAMAHFQKAVAVDSRFPEAHYNLGNALLIAGRPTEAIEQYEAALKLRDNFCEAYANMAMALAKLNRLEEARAMAHQALDLAKLQGKTEFAQQIKDWLASNRIDSNE